VAGGFSFGAGDGYGQKDVVAGLVVRPVFFFGDLVVVACFTAWQVVCSPTPDGKK